MTKFNILFQGDSMFFSCQENIQLFQNKLHNSYDLFKKIIKVDNKTIGFFYVKSLVDENLMSLSILLPIKEAKSIKSLKDISESIISNIDFKVVNQEDKGYEKQVVKAVLKGNVAIFLDDDLSALLVDVKQFPSRSPEEPPTSSVIFGPRVGFTESIETNIALMRNRIPSENFTLKRFIVGRYTQTQVVIGYISGIVSPATVKKVSDIIKKIDIDGIIDSNYILTFFQGESKIFKRAGVAEKPDIVTSKILEGRVAIFVNNSPIVLTVPFMIFEDFQNSNDYYTNSIYTSFIRIIRIIGVLIATVIPGVYLSLRLYHFKVLPLKFLITITSTTEGLPFTPFIELLFILILFHILYEVSLRLPRYLGLATSIVGALILGQTGVEAGLISPPAVVIIAMSLISVYTISDQFAQITLLRAIFLILGGTVGLLGIVAGMIFFINEIATLNQFGTSYLAPYAPLIKKDLKDGIFKKSVIKLFTRPESIKVQNKVRLKNEK